MAPHFFAELVTPAFCDVERHIVEVIFMNVAATAGCVLDCALDAPWQPSFGFSRTELCFASIWLTFFTLSSA